MKVFYLAWHGVECSETYWEGSGFLYVNGRDESPRLLGVTMEAS